MNNMATYRTRIQIDASAELQAALRKISSDEYKTIRVVVLMALADKYPELKPLVDKELKG